MGKLDHIIELTGADTYSSWRRSVRLALAGKGLWNHCSMGTDPNDFAEYASTFPVAVAAGKPTDDERKCMKEWIKEDAQAKAIIGRKLSPVVQNMLDEALSAREQWDVLAQRFSRLDVTSQFELHSQLFSERLKDAEDAPRYLGVLENGQRRFAEMGVVFTDKEAIFMLLNGFPETPQWIIFRGLTIGMYASSSAPVPSTSSTTSPPAPPKITFQAIATSFSEEANRQRSQLKMAKPGSEYANAASGSHTPGELRNNPANGIRIHKYNPKGVPCDNPVCAGLPRSLTHDREHCLQPGGGAEGTKSSWGRKPSKANLSKKDVAASATESKPDAQQTSSTSNESTSRRELACATITEISSGDSTMSKDNLACIARQALSTILDSGATSTLITDQNVFWTYSEKSKVTVKTANHGTLSTSGCGDCVAELSINGQVHRIHLTHCLHAPGAIINLLSIGHMLQKGWECNFKPNPACCELVYHNSSLGSLPMVGNLFFLDLKFLTPDTLSIRTKSPQEISAFAHVPLSWDLWHARMGHPGGDAVRRLPMFASGVKVNISTPLQCCEPCIMAKHPRKPYLPSETPRTARMLDLIHSDLCGPFPIATPHGKNHFIIFLDDHMNLLNLQLLANKSQALDAWMLVKNKWENHAECSVKVFRSDNRGEFMSSAFTDALAVAGIERQLSAPYAHQQNGKAECAIRTLEGRLFAMLETAQLPATFWGEAALTACYLWNRSESSVLPPGKTPYELVNKRQPDLSHLCVFGARCFAHIPSELQSKLGPHSRHAIFLGYPEGVKGYRL
jgi:hypothetical protein